MNEPTNSAKGTELPRGMVLSYVTVANSPTRVRIIAARSVLIVGLIDLALGLLCMAAIGWILWDAWSTYFAGSGYTLLDLVEEMLGQEEYVPLFAALCYFIAGGGTLVLCARAVRRGNRVACYFGGFALIPPMLFWIVAGAIAGIGALWPGLGLFGERANPLALLWLVVTAVSIVVTLLLWDVVNFLRWIARNPLEEKPAKLFIPGLRNAVSRSGTEAGMARRIADE